MTVTAQPCAFKTLFKGAFVKFSLGVFRLKSLNLQVKTVECAFIQLVIVLSAGSLVIPLHHIIHGR